MSRPRPVLTSAGIAGVITSIAGVLAFLGYANASTDLSNEAQSIGASAIAAFAFGSHLLAGLHAQSKVTPKVSPQADDGTPLVRADTARAVPGAIVTTLVSSPAAAEASEGPTEAYADDVAPVAPDAAGAHATS